MQNQELEKYGITGVTEVVHNPSFEELFEAEMDPTLEGYEKGQPDEELKPKKKVFEKLQVKCYCPPLPRLPQ